jgi:hypothetical protein
MESITKFLACTTFRSNSFTFSRHVRVNSVYTMQVFSSSPLVLSTLIKPVSDASDRTWRRKVGGRFICSNHRLTGDSTDRIGHRSASDSLSGVKQFVIVHPRLRNKTERCSTSSPPCSYPVWARYVHCDTILEELQSRSEQTEVAWLQYYSHSLHTPG